MTNYRILIEEDAKLDIAEGFDWYSKISQKLSESFLIKIKESIRYLEDNPLLFQFVYKDFRHVGVKNFPFVIIYKIDKKNVKVYRVFPTKMNPTSKFKIIRN